MKCASGRIETWYWMSQSSRELVIPNGSGVMDSHPCIRHRALYIQAKTGEDWEVDTLNWERKVSLFNILSTLTQYILLHNQFDRKHGYRHSIRVNCDKELCDLLTFSERTSRHIVRTRIETWVNSGATDFVALYRMVPNLVEYRLNTNFRYNLAGVVLAPKRSHFLRGVTPYILLFQVGDPAIPMLREAFS